MAVDIRTFFNDVLPAALSRHAGEVRLFGARYQLNIVGARGGSWNVDATPTGPSCTADQGPANCTITMTDDDFEKFLELPAAAAVQLVFEGRLRISGNPVLAQKLQRLFAYC